MVSGRSMEPTLYNDDLVITRKQASYDIGDVVAFRVEGGMVIHRIVGGNGHDGFELQGDNNAWVDTWRPTTEEIVGKQWLHLPGKAAWLRWLQDPARMTGLFGGVAALGLVKVGNDTKKRKRRRDGGHMKASDSQQSGGPGFPGLSRATVALGVAAATTLLLGVAAFSALRAPSTKSAFVARAAYEHVGAFDYLVRAAPSTLYPSGSIGPVTAPPGGAVSQVELPPLYTKLTRSADIGFNYTFKADAVSDLRGEIGATLQVKAQGEGGWVVRQELAPPEPFEGAQAGIRIPLDLAPIQALIARIEEETGFTATAYELAVVPSVRLTGSAGGEAIDESFAPAFRIVYTKTTLSFDSALLRTEPKTLGSTVVEKQTWLLGLPVGPARFAVVLLTAIGLGATGLLAAVVFLGLWQPEVERVRTRYGTKLVSVTAAKTGANRVQVARLEDLAMLAQRDGRIIFSRQTPEGEVYFVPDGATTYEYARLRETAGEEV
jgi:signal peptidase I